MTSLSDKQVNRSSNGCDETRKVPHCWCIGGLLCLGEIYVNVMRGISTSKSETDTYKDSILFLVKQFYAGGIKLSEMHHIRNSPLCVFSNDT